MPSPGTAIGLVALFAALATTALALPGRNTVDSGDIRNGQVKAADIARNAVTGKHVKEKSLGAVPNATAVGGNRVESFRIEVPDDAPEQQLTLGGVRMDATCDGGTPELFAAKARDGAAVFHSFGLIQDPPGTDVFGKQEGSFSPNDSEPLVAIPSNAGQVTAHVLFADGRATRIDAAYRNVPPGGGSACVFWGDVTSD